MRALSLTGPLDLAVATGTDPGTGTLGLFFFFLLLVLMLFCVVDGSVPPSGKTGTDR